MSLNNVMRPRPMGGLALTMVLAGTLVAQVVPAAGNREKPSSPPTFIVPPGTPAGKPANASPARASAAGRKQEDKDDEINVLIAQALDQPTDLDLKKTEIREAFDKLASKTGIPIEIEPGTLNLLPYGSKTAFSATIKGTPLRGSLTELLRPIGLEFQVESKRVVIRATPPLRRVVDRATWTELALIEKLYKTPWSDELAQDFPLKLQFQQVSGGLDVLRGAAGRIGNGSAAEVLEQATAALGCTWYPSGDTIVVLPRTRQIERQLEKKTSAVYSQASLADVLQDLTSQAGVPLRLDPGVLATLPPGVDRFTLSFQNTPIRQILELISGQTGLAYFIEPEDVRIAANALSAPTTRPAADADSVQEALKQLRSNPIVGQITLPMGKDSRMTTIFVRQDDLPQDLKDALPSIKAVAIQMMRESLSKQPATQPAQ